MRHAFKHTHSAYKVLLSPHKYSQSPLMEDTKTGTKPCTNINILYSWLHDACNHEVDMLPRWWYFFYIGHHPRLWRTNIFDISNSWFDFFCQITTLFYYYINETGCVWFLVYLIEFDNSIQCTFFDHIHPIWPYAYFWSTLAGRKPFFFNSDF